VRSAAALLAALAALSLAGRTVHPSGAAFTATSTNPSNTFTAASDWVRPALTFTAPADGAYTTDTTPTFGGAAGTAAGDQATVTVRVYAGATATGTPVQTLTPAVSAAAWSTTAATLADGTYTVRATQSDNAANTATVDHRLTVDTKAPTPVMISAANAGGTAGRLNAGDVISYRFSEAIDPASVLPGFAGGATTANVIVRFTNFGNSDRFTVLDASAGTTVKLDTRVTTSGQYVTSTVSWPATLRQSADGTTFTVTLGTAPASGVATTVNTALGMAWTATAGPKDLAGNAMTVPGTAITETDGDVDF